ncbi:MAG: hypothetical protein AAF483_04765 [Planctomycetota bacterium]
MTRLEHRNWTPVLFLLIAFLQQTLNAQESDSRRIFLIGNSLTWDTVPPKLDGKVQWHVDCGKSLPYMVENPEDPCVKTSTIWPNALKENTFDILCIQLHYGSTFDQDLQALKTLIDLQPTAKIVLHTGWARHAERAGEWGGQSSKGAKIQGDTRMSHCIAYFEAMLERLRKEYPKRSFARTNAMDALQQVELDIASSTALYTKVEELYRDAIHMNVVTGRYLMHNAMRQALGQSFSKTGFEKLDGETQKYFDSVLEDLASESLQDDRFDTN